MEGKRTGKLNLRLVEPSQVIEEGSNIGVVFSEHFLEYPNCSFVKRCCLVQLPLKIEMLLHNGAGLWREMD